MNEGQLCLALVEGGSGGRHPLKQQSHLCGSNQNKLNKKTVWQFAIQREKGRTYTRSKTSDLFGHLTLSIRIPVRIRILIRK